MGAKKKVQVQPQPPPPPLPEKPPNTILKILTSEQTEFKLSEELFTRHSKKAKSLVDSSKDGTIRLNEIDGSSFEVIFNYFELHKEKEPIKIVVPIRTNQTLKNIMEEEDAELIEKVMAKGDEAMLKLMDAALFLEVESLRKRLGCGVAIKLMQFTIEEIKDEYDLNDYSFEEEGLRAGTKNLIEQLKKNSMEQES